MILAEEEKRNAQAALKSVELEIRSVEAEIRNLKRDLYGNPEIRDQGVFTRIENLEQKFYDLRESYLREKIEKDHFSTLETQVEKLAIDYRLGVIYLKGIAVGTGTILLGLGSAAVIGIARYFIGAGG